MRYAESAGGVVVNMKGEVLVVSQHGTSWSLPKGHVEEEENHIDAAKREILEESGVRNLLLVKNLGSYKRFKISKDNRDDKGELKTIHMFLFRTTENKLTPLDPENPEARWVPRDEVAELLTHPKDKEFYCGILYELENVRM